MYNRGCYTIALIPAIIGESTGFEQPLNVAQLTPSLLASAHSIEQDTYSSRWENEPRYKVKYILLYRHIILPPWPSSDQLQGVHGLKHAMCMNRLMPVQQIKKARSEKTDTESISVLSINLYAADFLTEQPQDLKFWSYPCLAVVLVKPPSILCVNSPIDFLWFLLLSHTCSTILSSHVNTQLSTEASNLSSS